MHLLEQNETKIEHYTCDLVKTFACRDTFCGVNMQGYSFVDQKFGIPTAPVLGYQYWDPSMPDVLGSIIWYPYCSCIGIPVLGSQHA